MGDGTQPREEMPDLYSRSEQLLELNVRLLKEAHAKVENYQEGCAYALQRLKHCKGCSSQPIANELTNLFNTLLGMDGKAHLKALRDHEALVMGLLAYRANAIEALLPDTCPGCGAPGRQHLDGCRFGLALTLLPEGMPSIEQSATFKLGVIGQQLRTWADDLDASATAGGGYSVAEALREVAARL